ncbi:MAG: cupredoxin family copper-binding protein, partial [Mycobacterium sp.]
LATAGFVLAGCSHDDETAAPPSLTLVTQAGATSGMPGMSSMPDMPAMSAAITPAEAPAPQAGNTVDINNFAFAPATLTVPVGATVTWTNRDEEPHTVVAGNGSFRSPGMGTGATYSFTFTNAGSFDYICSIHPFMHGTVVVTQ